MTTHTKHNPQADSTPWLWIILISISAALFTAVLGYWMGMRSVQLPATDSVEAGFARDMITHHSQAVEMSSYLYLHTDDPEMRQLAFDIMLSQQAQIGQFQGWLTVWDVPIASTVPAMSWMDMPTTGLMPGMASREQLEQLRSLEGTEADILFLQLMIPHHRSAVEMADYVLQYTRQLEVNSLAAKIVVTQQSEIDYMQTLLVNRGADPAPDPGMMHHPTEVP
jgi:uncharacterized protein (DUF305 family)